jgi:hypothetical protein
MLWRVWQIAIFGGVFAVNHSLQLTENNLGVAFAGFLLAWWGTSIPIWCRDRVLRRLRNRKNADNSIAVFSRSGPHHGELREQLSSGRVGENPGESFRVPSEPPRLIGVADLGHPPRGRSGSSKSFPDKPT